MPRRGLLVAGALSWGAFAVLVWLMLGGHMTGFDRTGLLVWRGADLMPTVSDKAAEMVRDITGLGGVLLRNVFAALAVAVLLFLRRRGQALTLTATVLLGWIFNSALKDLFARARPDVVPHLMHAGSFSFPSGHSFNGTVVYMSIALTFAALAERQSARLAILALGIAVSLAIAWSRVWLGVHWPSDAMAGWAGGAGWALIASALCHSRTAGRT